jgi:23S rRNA pseudouridine2605 synthase
LLLTNDGEYSRKLELPANNFERTYLVKIFGIPDKQVLKMLEKGIIIDGIEYKKIIAKIEEQTLNNAWLKITLIEGKNREIRNVMNYLGYRIKRLIRIEYGPYKLGKLEKGKVIEVETKCLE